MSTPKPWGKNGKGNAPSRRFSQWQWDNDKQWQWYNDKQWDDDKQWSDDKQRGKGKQWGNARTTRAHKDPKGVYATKEDDFGGAYPGVALDIDKAAVTCALCQKCFRLWGYVANMIWPSCDTFFRFEDKTVTQVAQVMQAGDIAYNDYIPFRNMGIDAGGNPIKVAQVCYMCVSERQENNMNYYAQVRPDGSLRLASHWQHKQ